MPLCLRVETNPAPVSALTTSSPHPRSFLRHPRASGDPGAVRERRKELGWTQKVLGARAKIDDQTISNIENAQAIPTLYDMSRIGDALGLPLYRFFTARELIPAPDTLRADERAILDALTTLPDTDVRMVREMVDAVVRGRG